MNHISNIYAEKSVTTRSRFEKYGYASITPRAKTYRLTFLRLIWMQSPIFNILKHFSANQLLLKLSAEQLSQIHNLLFKFNFQNSTTNI